jgi:hypothetical protein
MDPVLLLLLLLLGAAAAAAAAVAPVNCPKLPVLLPPGPLLQQAQQ